MTLTFDAVDFIRSLEKAGLPREAAEAITRGVDGRNRQLAMQDELARLATKAELETALARQTIQFGVMLGAGLALAVAAIGVIVSAL